MKAPFKWDDKPILQFTARPGIYAKHILLERTIHFKNKQKTLKMHLILTSVT